MMVFYLLSFLHLSPPSPLTAPGKRRGPEKQRGWDMRCCDCSSGSCVQKEIELTGGAVCVYSKPADPSAPALISPAPDRASLLSPRRFIAARIGHWWSSTEGMFEMCSSERLNAAFKMQVREAEQWQAAVFLLFPLLVFRQFTLVSPTLRLPESPPPSSPPSSPLILSPTPPPGLSSDRFNLHCCAPNGTLPSVCFIAAHFTCGELILTLAVCSKISHRKSCSPFLFCFHQSRCILGQLRTDGMNNILSQHHFQSTAVVGTTLVCQKIQTPLAILLLNRLFVGCAFHCEVFRTEGCILEHALPFFYTCVIPMHLPLFA